MKHATLCILLAGCEPLNDARPPPTSWLEFVNQWFGYVVFIVVLWVLCK